MHGKDVVLIGGAYTPHKMMERRLRGPLTELGAASVHFVTLEEAMRTFDNDRPIATSDCVVGGHSTGVVYAMRHNGLAFGIAGPPASFGPLNLIPKFPGAAAEIMRNPLLAWDACRAPNLVDMHLAALRAVGVCALTSCEKLIKGRADSGLTPPLFVSMRGDHVLGPLSLPPSEFHHVLPGGHNQLYLEPERILAPVQKWLEHTQAT